MCAVSLSNHRRAVADAFWPLKTNQRYQTSETRISQKLNPSNH